MYLLKKKSYFKVQQINNNTNNIHILVCCVIFSFMISIRVVFLFNCVVWAHTHIMFELSKKIEKNPINPSIWLCIVFFFTKRLIKLLLCTCEIHTPKHTHTHHNWVRYTHRLEIRKLKTIYVYAKTTYNKKTSKKI